MKITKDMIKESIDSNMDSFRDKALKGNIDGEDVAKLFGYGKLYDDGLLEEKEVEEIANAVEKTELTNEEEDTDVENTWNDVFYDSVEDFLKGTETKVTIKNIGCEPAPIFGPNDRNYHNKYRVYLSNPKGKTSFVYWDSVANTQKGKEPTIEDVLYAIVMDVEAYAQSLSFDDFKKRFGYDETSDAIAQKAFDGCRKHIVSMNKIFSSDELGRLFELMSDF